MPARVGSEAQAMRDLWTRAAEDAKLSVKSPTVYRALEKTIPIAWEDGVFVIGFAGHDGQLAGQINNTEMRNLLERALRTQSKDAELRFRIIDGASYEDWESAKKRDAVALASRQQVVEKRNVETKAFTSWDEVYDQVSRLWANSEFRALPTGRARYFSNAFDIVIRAMDAIYPKEGKVEEPVERGLCRIIDRIASMTGSDSALVAYLLLERRKASAGQSSDS